MNLFVLCSSLSVVAALLCIVLSSEASNIMQCTEDRQSDGQFYFSMSYDVKRTSVIARPNGLLMYIFYVFMSKVNMNKFVIPLKISGFLHCHN